MGLAAAALAGALAASSPPSPGGGAPPAPGGVRCILVAPVENDSEMPEAAPVVNEVLHAADGALRGRALPERDLRALFAGSPLELPDGVPPSIALDLAELLGADAVLFGSVTGYPGNLAVPLRVELQLGLSGSRSVARTASAAAIPRAGEDPVAALRRAAAEAAAQATAAVGGPPLPTCFDPARLERVRAAALAAGGAHVAPRRAVARASPRQADWSSRLASGARFLLEGVAFDGRSARILRSGGLDDLAGALRASPGVRLRLEGFVDASGSASDDAQLSLAMAHAAADRLVALGIPVDRITWAGRGGDAPLLPNFTARGRARNRRLEAVPLLETASRP